MDRCITAGGRKGGKEEGERRVEGGRECVFGSVVLSVLGRDGRWLWWSMVKRRKY